MHRQPTRPSRTCRVIFTRRCQAHIQMQALGLPAQAAGVACLADTAGSLQLQGFPAAPSCDVRVAGQRASERTAREFLWRELKL